MPLPKVVTAAWQANAQENLLLAVSPTPSTGCLPDKQGGQGLVLLDHLEIFIRRTGRLRPTGDEHDSVWMALSKINSEDFLEPIHRLD